MLTLDNLTCIRGDKVLFKDLGITFGEGSLTIVKGPNGSGKSSLLKIVANLLDPTLGSIMYNEQIINQDTKENYFKDLVYLGHKNALSNNLSVEDNVAFWAKLAGSYELLLETALHYFQLSHLREVTVNKLSMGLCKRVELTRLITKKAKIWLLDEPYSFLDEEGKKLLDALIMTKANQKGIIIIASNDEIAIKNQTTLSIPDFWQ